MHALLKELKVHSALSVLLNYCLTRTVAIIHRASPSFQHPENHSQKKSRNTWFSSDSNTKRSGNFSNSGAKIHGQEKWSQLYNVHNFCLLTKTVLFLLNSVWGDKKERWERREQFVSVPQHIAPDMLTFKRKMITLCIPCGTHIIILCSQNMVTAKLHPEIIMTWSPHWPDQWVEIFQGNAKLTYSCISTKVTKINSKSKIRNWKCR